MCFVEFSGSVFFVRRISYKEVRKATDSFQRIVYSNSEVSAYAANFGEGCGGVCLVKEVKDFDRGNDESFHKQVQLLGRLHHRHLLSLKGFSLGHDRKSKRFHTFFTFFFIGLSGYPLTFIIIPFIFLPW